MQSSLWQVAHDILVKGALGEGGSWGGPECAKAVPMAVHYAEDVVVITVLLVLYFACGFVRETDLIAKQASKGLAEYRKSNSSESISSQMWLDRAFSLVHFALYAQLIYYKATMSSLINLIQPCHVICLLQGFALYSQKETGVLISIFVLPSLTGCFLAMLFPDTSGLNQFLELEAYWVQHVVILLMPLYLLCRKDFLALRLATTKSVFVGLWICAFLHWSLYEIVDLALLVNVEFMLCPTGAMLSIFPLLPSWLTGLFSSYRVMLTLFVSIVAFPIAYFYIYTAFVLFKVYNSKAKKV